MFIQWQWYHSGYVFNWNVQIFAHEKSTSWYSVFCLIQQYVTELMFPKFQLWIRWLQIIRQYTNYLVLAYITDLVIYSNQDHMSFTIGILVYLVSMIPEWLVVSLECTGICAWEKHFLPHFLHMNSTLCHWTQNSPKYYHTFRIINLGRGSMCYWKKSLYSGSSSCIYQQIRNGQVILLFQNDKRYP